MCDEWKGPDANTGWVFEMIGEKMDYEWEVVRGPQHRLVSNCSMTHYLLLTWSDSQVMSHMDHILWLISRCIKLKLWKVFSRDQELITQENLFMVDIYMHPDLNQKAAIFMLFKVLILIFLTVRGLTDICLSPDRRPWFVVRGPVHLQDPEESTKSCLGFWYHNMGNSFGTLSIFLNSKHKAGSQAGFRLAF